MSRIDFSLSGYDKELAKIISIKSSRAAIRWLKRNMPDLYRLKTFRKNDKASKKREEKIQSENDKRNKVEKIKNDLLKIEIGPHEYGWTTRVALVLGKKRIFTEVKKQLREQFPDIYEKWFSLD